MNNLTVKELRILAKDLGIKGYSKMKKADLIQIIEATKERNERKAFIDAKIEECRKASSDLRKKYIAHDSKGLADAHADSFVEFMLRWSCIPTWNQEKEISMIDDMMEEIKRLDAELELWIEKYYKPAKAIKLIEEAIELELEEKDIIDLHNRAVKIYGENYKLTPSIKKYFKILAEQKQKEKDSVNVDPKELLIEAYELMEGEFNFDYDTLNEKIYQVLCSVDATEYASWMEADKFDFLYENIEKLDKKESESVTFNPENTAIDTRFSASADMIAKEITADTPVLDYGCGTGRNMRHIIEKTGAVVDGTDIPEQLEKEKDKHDQLRAKGSIIANNDIIPDEYYKVALNSHVLNVIESDAVKQFVVNDIYKKLTTGGKAYIEVRTKQDVEGAKTKEPHGDGWKIKCKGGYTYQEGISKEKMQTLVSNAGFKIEKHICNSSKHIMVVAK